MKKIVMLLVALGLFPALVSAQSLAERQLHKINAKEALKFPQPEGPNQEVIAAAKKVYEQNKGNFAAVYNYAVVLSVEEEDEFYPPYAPEKAIGLFKEALKLKPNSPSCYAALGYLMYFTEDFVSASYGSSMHREDAIFINAVREKQKEAETIVKYINKAIALKYDGSLLGVLKNDKKELEKALAIVKGQKATRQVKQQLSTKKNK